MCDVGLFVIGGVCAEGVQLFGMVSVCAEGLFIYLFINEACSITHGNTICYWYKIRLILVHN